MAAKGTLAKNAIINKIADLFGDKYAGCDGSKIYLWENDGSYGMTQICLTLTAPKNIFEGDGARPEKINTSSGHSFEDGWDFDDAPTVAKPKEKAEITEEEKKFVEDMMKRLNL